ncbi:MAG TPA: U32 family peptidase [Rhodocyclaceae bacterium]|nr:U32 family peptidase [Rhodocyclaceae bacterium]
MAAIDHGADAVYIGGPAFGARASAENGVADIARLAAHAHRYNAKVFVALNTILRDDELEEARRLAWQIYEAGADALIVQDMGLLEVDLPPIQLHASTQTDIRHVSKARFLQDVGFSQIVLARELDLKQIKAIAANTHINLEFFIHGALCVAYSGQCYISHAHTGRSANRGECSQACRLPYTLTDPTGAIVAHEQHLLSMKDNDQSANLRALADAGISSFKIEGRLKDLSYVKNITAHYRQLLDEIMEDAPEYRRASSGRSTYTFVPQPEKTFNRGSTDYFVNDRKADIGAFDTPKFSGTPIGTVVSIGHQWFDVEAEEELHNGDGISFFDTDQDLVGLRINRVEKQSRVQRLFPAALPEQLKVGTQLYRNRDQEFERQLDKKSADRRIRIWMQLTESANGFVLSLTDEDGVTASASLTHAKEAAQNADKALSGLRDNLGKLGSTIYEAVEITLDLSQPWFVPASAANNLRREAVEALDAARIEAYQRPSRDEPVVPPVAYPDTELSYLANVYNDKARAFYQKHGVQLIDAAYEANAEKGEVSLMITKHCLRYSFNLCPKEVKGIRPEPMTLMQGKDKLTLTFDCKRCEMHVVGKMRKHRSIPIKVAPAH